MSRTSAWLERRLAPGHRQPRFEHPAAVIVSRPPAPTPRLPREQKRAMNRCVMRSIGAEAAFTLRLTPIRDQLRPVAVEEVQRLGEVEGLRAKSMLAAPARQGRHPAAAARGGGPPAGAAADAAAHTRSGAWSRVTPASCCAAITSAGKLSTPIADRDVRDRFIELSPDERRVHDAVEGYISTAWNQATGVAGRNAVGFVMTIYRRRLASSFFALARTLEGTCGVRGAQRNWRAATSIRTCPTPPPRPSARRRRAAAARAACAGRALRHRAPAGDGSPPARGRQAAGCWPRPPGGCRWHRSRRRRCGCCGPTRWRASYRPQRHSASRHGRFLRGCRPRSAWCAEAATGSGHRGTLTVHPIRPLCAPGRNVPCVFSAR